MTTITELRVSPSSFPVLLSTFLLCLNLGCASAKQTDADAAMVEKEVDATSEETAACESHCQDNTLITCSEDGKEVAVPCEEQQFCGSEPLTCSPLVVAGYAEKLPMYWYPNNDNNGIDEIVGMQVDITETTEIRRLGLIVDESSTPLRFYITANDNPDNVPMGTILYQQSVSVDAKMNEGRTEVALAVPITVDPGKYWLLIKAPQQTRLTASWDADRVTGWYGDKLTLISPVNLYVKGAAQ